MSDHANGLAHRGAPSRVFLLAAALLALVFTPFSVWGQDTVYWPYFSFPPLVVLDGAGRPSGISIDVQDMLFQALDDAEHQRIQSPLTRSMANVKAGETYCFTGILRSPERESLLAYSLPCRLSAPNVVVARKGELDDMVQDGAVGVAKLLEREGLRLGLVSGFSYGPVLDGIIAKAPPDRVYDIRSMGSMEHQTGLLLAGRIDWIITFPAQALYEARETDIVDRLDFLPIAEEQDWLVGYVACTDNDQGREVVGRVNRVLSERVPTEAYRNLFLDWVDPGQREEFLERYERLLAEPARNWRP